MQELTDSYCERCGTRHVFSASASKGLSLKRARVLARGLKNFVLNDGQSMSDSITTARLEDESGDSSRMTEAFHKAFNFCMTCRQYACDKCWNAQAGACLSCAPQVDSAPVAPEDRLIVRTPVARWNTDWLDFSDSEGDVAAGSSAPSLPVGWPGPLQLSPLIPPQARQDNLPHQVDQPTAPAQPAAWPTADLPGPTSAGAGPNGRNGRLGRKASDPGAWNLWPVADELAPEMTLTPEEMMLVKAELSQPESGEPAGAPAPSVEDATRLTAGPGLEAIPSRSTSPAREPVAPSHPQPTPMAPVTPESHPASPSRIAPTPVLRVRPAPQAATRHEPVEPVGIVARLLGHHAANDKREMPDAHESTAGDGVPTESWPRPTPWTESSLGARYWWGEGAHDPSHADTLADEAAEQVVAQEPTHERSSGLPAAARGLADSDSAFADEPPDAADLGEARSAATLRQTAVAHSATYQADDVAAAAEPVAQLDAAAGPEADTEVAEVARRETASQPVPVHQAADAAPAEPSTPPVSWPPFGASWPAPDARGGTWPGPEAPISAVLAAQQAQPPFAAEMWAQSSQEVMNRGTVRVCHRCALPVSTQARFCRRCGTQQA